MLYLHPSLHKNQELRLAWNLKVFIIHLYIVKSNLRQFYFFKRKEQI